jgi:hypothetical protein
VRRAELQEWQPVGPLLTLNSGDTVRVTGNASVVVLLAGGRGTVTVDVINSPFVVTFPPVQSNKLTRVWALVEESVKVLLKVSRDSTDVTLGSRGDGRSLIVLMPENGTVLPDSLVFEWIGDEMSRHTVRIVGPSGPLLEHRDFVGTRFAYPADASPLAPGIRYQLQVTKGAKLLATAGFKVMDPEQARNIRRDVTELEAAVGPKASANTLVVIQVAYLMSQDLFVDARLILLEALAEQPDDPAYRVVLSNLYEQVGLSKQTARSLAEAQAPKGRPRR